MHPRAELVQKSPPLLENMAARSDVRATGCDSGLGGGQVDRQECVRMS
jgi:hypothetical protein